MKKSVLLSFLLSVIVITSFAQIKRRSIIPSVHDRTQKMMIVQKATAPQPVTLKMVDSLAGVIQAQIDAGSFPNTTVKKSVDSLFNLFTNAAGKLNYSVPVVPNPLPGTLTVHAIINLNGASGQTISGYIIDAGKGSKPTITLTNSHDIHITGNKLLNSNTVGILLTNCYNITIDGNFITNVSTGVYVTNSTGGGIVVNSNQFKNMNGPFPRGQFVQFNNVSGAGLSISYNKCENILGSSYPEDAINIYMSNGTSGSPINIVGNWIRGGGPSKSGGGIMTGDYGGSYQYVADNILVDPGQYGLGIAGGHDITFMNNKVYARSQSFTNVGVVVWTQGGVPAIKNATVGGNHINYTSGSTSDGSFLNPYWIGNVNGVKDATPALWSTNVWNDANINASILPKTIITMN